MVEHIGSGTLYTSPIHSISNISKPIKIDAMDCEIGFDANDIPEYVKSIYCPMSIEAEANFECNIDAKILKKLTGIDLAYGSDFTGYTIQFHQPVQVQVRRHKKKRINKKWAKRYGYKTVFKSVKLEEACIKPNENGFDILGRKFICN